MKIAVMGYSGCGKSTLANELGRRCGADVLHLDRVFWLPDWRQRTPAKQRKIVASYLRRHDGWIIDGNYFGMHLDRRMEAADQVILLCLPRLTALFRVLRRYLRYRGSARPDMPPGCPERLDRHFIWWVLWKGRDRRHRERLQTIQALYPEKTIVLKSQRQIDRYLKNLRLGASV